MTGSSAELKTYTVRRRAGWASPEELPIPALKASDRSL
jgi:hypothetical protein